MNSLALQVQEALQRDPHAGDLYVFRGKRGDLLKILWHDGLGMSLYAKRLERGKFIWPSPVDWRSHICRAARLYAGGHRLEKSATNLAARVGGLTEQMAVVGKFPGARLRAIIIPLLLR